MKAVMAPCISSSLPSPMSMATFSFMRSKRHIKPRSTYLLTRGGHWVITHWRCILLPVLCTVFLFTGIHIKRIFPTVSPRPKSIVGSAMIITTIDEIVTIGPYWLTSTTETLLNGRQIRHVNSLGLVLCGWIIV